jgi:coproporphyrinogen III oxidase-like Fe-S oxidoreductase
LKAGEDFTLGYSPERINPGDREHTLERITKVVAGQDPVEGTETLDPASVAIEEAYLGLRTTNGLRINPANASDFALWRDRGWAVVVDHVGRLTPSGWLRLDSLVADLTDVRSRY